MKKVLLFASAGALLAACSSSSDEMEDWLNDLESTTIENLEEQSEDFASGLVYSASTFFDGMVAENVEVSIKFQEIEDIYYEGGTAEEITARIDDCVEQANHCLAALEMNSDADYPQAQAWLDLSEEWTNAVLDLCNNYCYDMVEVWTTDYDGLTDEQLTLWDDYDMAYDEWYDLDYDWVEFQDVFADANGILLSDEGYDIDELAEQDMDEHGTHHEE